MKTTENKNSIHVFKEGIKEISSKIVLRPMDELVLRHGRFEVVKRLGEGGFGIVYHIKNETNQYALKILKLWEIHPTEHTEMRSRFAREFKVGQSVKSKYIISNLGTGMLEGNPYFIMEFCSGGNLEDKMQMYADPQKLKPLAINILAGLKALHKEGIIHRDIKPENVIFDHFQTPKLTDFGISGYVNNRVTNPNWRGGGAQKFATIPYLPPEQWLNEGFKTMGPVTDIFAFGVMMYQVLAAGHFPYATPEQIVEDHKGYFKKLKSGKFVPIKKYVHNLSEDWAYVIEKSILPDHRSRFQDTDSILQFWNISPEEVDVSQRQNFSRQASGNPGDWVLQIKNGDEPGVQYNLTQIMENRQEHSQILTIGWRNLRKPNTNHIEIVENYTAYVSGRHATLERGQNRRWRIRDGQWYNKHGNKAWHLSTNGTWVNSTKIDMKGKTLAEGDIITIGDTTLKVIQI